MIDYEFPPKVIVKCPATMCSFNLADYCSGTPWIDMKFDGKKVTCLDFVNEEQLNDN